MMKENVYLDNFTRDSVDLRIQGNSIWRRNYINSMQGRQMVQDEVPEPFRSVIFLMWGDSPTLDESIAEQFKITNQGGTA